MKSQENAFLFSLLLCLLLFAGQAQSFGCGIRNKSEDKHHRVRRVIGGSDAEMNSWPWIVNFINKTDSKQQCAGSIIDREWLLSAGHCFLSGDTLFPLENYTYRVADHMLNVIDTYEYQIQPSHVFIHPKYILGNDDLPGDYDISLIKLAQPLNFSEQVRAVCLPEKGTNFTKRDTCYLAGWGNIINNSTYNRSPVLKEAKLDLVSFEDCNRNVSYNGTIPNRFLCAGFPIGGTDGCYGDSGGPLQCERNGTWTQVGIMAWGQGCGQPNKYGVYSDIKVLLPFIRAIQAGPNGNLTAYYKKTFEETNPNITGRDLINLQKLFTRESYFSDVDLVRNLQLLPKEIKLLSRTTLKDLVFVSHVDNLTANATRLETITQVFRDQANRLDLYDKSKEVAQELNITFAEILKLSNLSKDDLLNDKADVFDKVRKMFYINSYLAKLRKYERMLEGYNTGIDITINQIKLIKELTMLSLNDLKKLDEKSLKQILVKGNIKVFTEKMTIRNISSFFDVALSQLKNTSVIEVLLEIFNINLGDYASMYQLTFQQVNVIKGVKISNVSNSGDFSLYNITGAILKFKETDECSEKDKRCSTRSTCKNVIGSFSCRCQKGYVGDGIRCSTGNTIYKSVIRLNELYSPSLNDPESYAYTVLAKKIQSGISRAVNSSKAFSGFVGTQVIGFRKGSVLADFLLVFALEEKDEINLSKLKDVLSSAIRSGFLLLSIDSSEPLKLSKTDLCKLGSHSCHENAICTPENDRFTCKCRPNFHGDGVNCEDPCNKTVCHSNSYCYRGLGGKAKCICDRDFGEDGDGKCIRMNDYKVLLIVVSCIAGVLFLVLLIILFCKYGRHQEKTVEINNREAGIHNTGYQNIHLQNIRENPRLQK